MPPVERANSALHRIAILLRFGMKPKVPISAARAERWALDALKRSVETK